VVLLALLIYLWLLSVESHSLPSFSHHEINFSSLLLLWISFVFSALVGLIFLAVGTLVWLYARDRRVAQVLFGFSFATMVPFATQIIPASDRLALTLTSMSSSLAVLLLSILLLLFPKNYLSRDVPSSTVSSEVGENFHSNQRQHYSSVFFLYGYVGIMTLLCLILAIRSIFRYLLVVQLPDWLNTVDNVYFLVGPIGILLTIIISYRQSSSRRARQQFRIFVSGVLLAFAPFFLLTVLPEALGFSPQYILQAQISTITLALFPLALGYTILRYQILVFDMYIRRAVAWVVGSINLAFLICFVIAFSSVLLANNVTASVVMVAIVMAVLGPCVWWLAHVSTERLFFSEILHYRRLIEKPGMMANETIDLNEASLLLMLSAVNAFETQKVCILVLDDDTGYYRLYPALKDDDPADAARRSLVQTLLHVARSLAHGGGGGPDWLDADEPILERLALATRPLLLSEASSANEALPTGLARYLTTTSPLDRSDPLLAPIRAQGKMIGVLVLGERGDYQQYAGPDFEAIHLILARFSPVLETARLYAQASLHVAILNTLYGASTMPIEVFETLDEVATVYTKVAAEAVTAGAEIWLYHEAEHLLRCVTHEGAGPPLVTLDTLTPSMDMDWSTWFYQGESPQARNGPSTDVPPCLSETPCFPFAWIPLKQGQVHIGILTLTYPRPHIFSHEEKRVLEMFASQCAAALENARITIELRAAYERQKELDQLKDQFIITASHELRTPLTAVVGYIELLAAYNLTLAPNVRADFIAKAHRGCDELTLMVGNIMDASRVEFDEENVSLCEVPLAESIQHVLEILEAMTRRENRTIQVDISSDVLVMADNVRLRQVLLNLVSNALKYSPPGSGIEITMDVDDERVTVRVQDHGLGVPQEEQEHLFERFVRLERDMNSPVRGAGLGLYISRQLVEAMGGRIWVESTGVPDEGSTFAFTLKRSKSGVDTQGHSLPQHQEV